jgi:hypothetical protein
MSKKENKIKLPPPKTLEHTEGGEGKKADAAGIGAAKQEGPKGNRLPDPRDGKQPVIWNAITARFRKPWHEPPSKKPSMTVPGMDTPVDILLNRYLSGQTITINGNPTYNEQLPPEYDHYDRVEKASFALKVNESLDGYEAQLRELEAKKKTAEVEAMRARIAELEALQDSNSDLKRPENLNKD